MFRRAYTTEAWIATKRACAVIPADGIRRYVFSEWLNWRKEKAMLTERQIQAVKAMADNDMRVTRAGEAMGIDGSTMYEFFSRIRKQTGLDPQRFSDLVKLVGMVGGADNG
jgi:hypothetical protein